MKYKVVFDEPGLLISLWINLRAEDFLTEIGSGKQVLSVFFEARDFLGSIRRNVYNATAEI